MNLFVRFLIVFIPVIVFFQEGKNQKITILNFKLEENASNFFNGEKGLECTFDVQFTEIIEDFFKQSYTITWRLVDVTGKEVFNSKNAIDFGAESVSANASPPFDNPSSTIALDEDVAIFLGYKNIDLPAGKQTVKLILSAEHEEKSFPNFYTKQFSFTNKKITIKPSSEQTFTISNVAFKYDDFFSEPFVEVEYDCQVSLGPGEVDQQKYPSSWQLMDSSGTVLFDSKTASESKYDNIDLSSYEKLEGKTGYHNSENSKMKFDPLVFEGRQSFTFAVFVEVAGVRKSIHKQPVTILLPETHAFEEQEFSISDVVVSQNIKSGVSGVSARFRCKFKYVLLQDSKAGKDYYFYLKIKQSGKEVYGYDSIPLVLHGLEFYEMNYHFLSKSSPDKYHDFELFIPFFTLPISAGIHELNVALHVSDKNKMTHFPVLHEGLIRVDKPRTKNGVFELSNLELAAKVYDTGIGIGAEKSKPDIQWFLYAGDYCLFESTSIKNQYFGSRESFQINISENDALTWKVFDIDGVFNLHDALGTVQLPTGQKKVTVENIQLGDIESLSYSLEWFE